MVLESLLQTHWKVFQILRLIFCIIGFLHFAYTVIHHNLIQLGYETYFGRFFMSYKFLTMWTNTVFLVYFVLRMTVFGLQTKSILQRASSRLSSFFDVVSEEKEDSKVKKAAYYLTRITVYTQVSLYYPMGLLVFTIYWTLIAINPKLVRPDYKEGDPVTPAHLGHMIHTSLLFFVLFDLLLFDTKYPNTYISMLIFCSYAVLYTIWMHVVYAFTSGWPYPIVSFYALPLRLVFIAGIFAFAVLFFFLSKIANYVLWHIRKGKETESMKTESMKTESTVK